MTKKPVCARQVRVFAGFGGGGSRSAMADCRLAGSDRGAATHMRRPAPRPVMTLVLS